MQGESQLTKLGRISAVELCQVIEKRILESAEIAGGIRNLLDYLDGNSAPLSPAKPPTVNDKSQPNIQDKLAEFNDKLCEQNDLLYLIQSRLKTFLGKE